MAIRSFRVLWCGHHTTPFTPKSAAPLRIPRPLFAARLMAKQLSKNPVNLYTQFQNNLHIRPITTIYQGARKKLSPKVKARTERTPHGTTISPLSASATMRISLSAPPASRVCGCSKVEATLERRGEKKKTELLCELFRGWMASGWIRRLRE